MSSIYEILSKGNPDEMDMPCPCDCGEWFDLNDGYGSLNPTNKTHSGTRVVCCGCHSKELEIQKEIDRIEAEIDLKERDGKGTKRLYKQLEKIQWP